MAIDLDELKGLCPDWVLVRGALDVQLTKPPLHHHQLNMRRAGGIFRQMGVKRAASTGRSQSWLVPKWCEISGKLAKAFEIT